VTPSRPRLGRWLYLTAAIVYLLDRATKVWVERSLATSDPIDVIAGVLRFRYTTNPGGAFGLFGGMPWLFMIATGVAAVAIVAASRHVEIRGVAVGLGLILGGALGNVTDRAIRGPGLSGRVVDFIDLHVWPVFNVADMGIVLGAALVVLASARRERRAARAEPADG
jgi:signal peptidase II